MDLVMVVSELEAGRTSTLGPRRLPPLHLFFLVLLVIYMAFLVGRCIVVLIRHSSAVPRCSSSPRIRAIDGRSQVERVVATGCALGDADRLQWLDANNALQWIDTALVQKVDEERATSPPPLTLSLPRDSGPPSSQGFGWFRY